MYKATRRTACYVFFSCILRLSQIFPTSSNPEQSVILFKITLHFICSPVNDVISPKLPLDFHCDFQGNTGKNQMILQIEDRSR